ncbi:retrovirus-related pol polyprotein from transposon TNT 1-94 [Tanacetum coccineum]
MLIGGITSVMQVSQGIWKPGCRLNPKEVVQKQENKLEINHGTHILFLNLVPIPIVTALMSKSAQAAPVGYGQIFVMLQSLPASCGPLVASLKSQSDSYGQLLIEKKEIKQDEEPTRGTLWLKGRVNKDGEYQDDKIRSVGDKLKETEDKIKEGTLQVDQGTDAMTLVLGKEKGGYARGVGSRVTYKRYFDLPRSKQAADERILLLESQLDAARCEREEKELLIKSMSSKMSQTEGMVTELKN